MSDVPVQVVIAAFKDENTASEALKALKQARNQGLIKIVDAAVLRKDEKGKLHIKETADMGGGKGAVIGGVAGGVIGLLAGPVGWAALGGAVIGGLAAKLKDGGFKDERLKKLGEGLGPGNSAIVAVVEHTWVREVEKANGRSGRRRVDRADQRRHRAAVAGGRRGGLDGHRDRRYAGDGARGHQRREGGSQPHGHHRRGHLCRRRRGDQG